ncbi:MAG: hypothetical protein ABJA16_07440, partial [Nakamurella sp.]
LRARRILSLVVAFAVAGMVGLVNGPAATAGVAEYTLVTVFTVPVMAGVPVTFNGETKSTDSTGTAKFIDSLEPQSGSLAARVSSAAFNSTIDGAPVQVKPARFVNEGKQRVLLALNIYWNITLAFVNGTDQQPIPDDRISTITLKNSIGEEIDVPPGGSIWVQGSRVVPLQGEFVDKKLTLTVQKVTYQGTNVVNSGQQSFLPSEVQSFSANLLFFSVDIQVGDGLFGFAAGDSIDLVFPDSHVENFALNDSGSVLIPSLPRGTYELTAVGGGLKLVQPLAVSRNQEIEVKLYTWLDIILLLLAGSVFVVVTVFVGIRKKRQHHHRTAGAVADPKFEVDNDDSHEARLEAADPGYPEAPHRSGDVTPSGAADGDVERRGADDLHMEEARQW